MLSMMKEWVFKTFVTFDVWVRLLLAFLMVIPLRVFLFDSWLIPFTPFFVAIFMESVRKFFPESKVYYVIYAYVMIGVLALVIAPWTRRIIDTEVHVVYAALGDRVNSEELHIADNIEPALDLDIEKEIIEQSHALQNGVARQKIERIKIINQKIKNGDARPEEIEEAKHLLHELRELRNGIGPDPVPASSPEPVKAPKISPPASITPSHLQQSERVPSKVAMAPVSAPPVESEAQERERLHMDEGAYQEYKGLLAIQHSDLLKNPITVKKPPIVVRKGNAIVIEIKNAVLDAAARMGEFTGTLPKGLYIGALKVVEKDTPVHGVVSEKNTTLVLVLTSIDAGTVVLHIRALCNYSHSIFTEASSSGESDSHALRFIVEDDTTIPDEFFITRP